MFRVDRIRAVTPTDETFPPSLPMGGTTLYHPRPDDPRITVELPRGASWVTESAPAESVEELADGRQRIVVPVSEPAWLERILLQIGPAAVVVDPPEWRDAGRAAAARVLERYA